jgi:hypothetical protein
MTSIALFYMIKNKHQNLPTIIQLVLLKSILFKTVFVQPSLYQNKVLFTTPINQL